MVSTPAPVRFRRIEAADLDAVAALLSEGFFMRPKAYWLAGLHRHAERPRPSNYPTYGYMIESGGLPVGVILMLFSEVQLAEAKVVRCNLSSWYTKPEFRNFSSLLIASATKDKSVTYFNVSPALHTWKTVEAQGFSAYCQGEFWAVPALGSPVAAAKVERFDPHGAHAALLEHELLEQHADLDCLSLVVRDGGELRPFVFRRSRMLRRLLPCFRLVYCREGDFVRYAGNLGRFLLRRGMPIVVVGADKPIEGLTGHFTGNTGRRYAKGPHRPGKTDIAFTEYVFFNI